MHLLSLKSSYKPYLWFLFITCSLLSIFLSYRYFSQAFPIVDVTLTMDRAQALEKAAQLTTTYNIGPIQYSQAASFNVDSQVKNYVEISLGGAAAFKKMLQEHYFYPYQWSVRHFKEYTINEVTLYFTPEGTPYGFKEKIAESEVGPALTVEQAEQQALKTARSTPWDIDFSFFTLVEKSHKQQPSGRVDYTFVYERNDQRLGEAPYRLTVEVCGDKVTQLLHSVKIPESFTRHYQEMRSSNTTIAFTALLCVLLLYVLGCCIPGFIILMRHHAFIWGPPLIGALLLALGKAADVFNTLPLQWNRYQTELSVYNFMSTLFVGGFLTFVGYAVISYVLLLLAEGLTRLAFGNHPRLWPAFTHAHTYAYAQRFLIGYGVVPFLIAFVVLFYIVTATYLGWWLPSDSLYEPNILATYIPWWSACVDSLSAGILEECLFRAIPLSCAALLGNRFGRRSWWITAMFIIQALIFGAAHASYATQPAYARLVELIIPSFIFGGMYLLFGLIPSILSHVIYDIIWMSLPLFVSTAWSSHVYQACIILISSIPLVCIVIKRTLNGRFSYLAAAYYNKNWKPSLAPKIPRKILQKTPLKTTALHRFVLIVTACICSSFLFVSHYDMPPVTLTRQEIQKIVQNLHIPGSWTQSSTIMVGLPKDKDIEMQHTFMWRTGGKELYQHLLGTYLFPPCWVARLATFEGTQQERAQEHFFSIDTTHKIIEHRHKISEHHALPTLSLEQAQQVATAHIQHKYALAPTDFHIISAVSVKQPERLDWVMVARTHTSVLLSHEGETRITVVISGNQITDCYAHIFVPEAWQRSYRQEVTLSSIIKVVCIFIIVMLLVLAAYFIMRYVPAQLLWRHGILFTGLLLLKSLISLINMWPSLSFHFDTAQPFAHQLWTVLGGAVMSSLFLASFIGLIVSIVHGICTSLKHASLRMFTCFWYGIAAGTIFTGVHNLLIWIGPKLAPSWPTFIGADSYIPALSIVLQNITNYIIGTLIVYTLVLFLDYVCVQVKHPFLGALWCTIFSICDSIAGNTTFHSYWILAGLLCGFTLFLLYYAVWRYHPATIPPTLLVFILANSWKAGLYHMYPGAFSGAVISTLVVGIFALWWVYLLWKPTALQR